MDFILYNRKLSFLATAFVLATLTRISLQSTDDGIPPVLTIKIADVELAEKEDARKRLGGGAVVECVDADGDPIRAYIQSILPTSGCGLKCLQLEPMGSSKNPTEFKLMFQPTDNFGTTPSYTLTIACTDDVEPVVINDMTVTIVTNTPPVFDPTHDSVNTHGIKTTHESAPIYTVATVDPDDDPVLYTMSTNPITDLIEIEYASGRIRAAQDLRLLCEEQVIASVNARDPFNPAVGPFTLDIEIDKNNVRPTITNLDTTIDVDEGLAANKRVLAFDVVDGKLSDFTYNQLSLSSAGIETYEVVSNVLKTQVELNYEREDQRSVKLYFTVNDGYCESETYSLTVNVNDLPEEPVFSYKEMFIEVDEGESNTPNNVFILDEDRNEVHTYSKDSGDDEFDVDPLSGNIVSVGEVLLRPNKLYKDYEVKLIATDKDGLQTATRYVVTVRVWDINNNRPYFTHANLPQQISANECTPPGANLGRLRGDDDDSDHNQNNWVYFGGGGGKFAVVPNGNIYLTQTCTNGESHSGTATIADQGINPGPLTGDPIEVVLTCGPCPAGGDGTGDGTDDGTSGTGDSSSGTGSDGSGSSGDGSSSSAFSTQDVLAWFIPALLGGVAWLALTALFIYRFSPPCTCGNPCAKSKTIQVKPEAPKPAQPTPPKAKPPPPPPKQVTPSPPPPPPPPRVVSPSEPYLYDFWKETYTNQDQTQHPDRKAMPTAIERMPAADSNAPPQNLRLGPPGSYNSPRGIPGNGSGSAALPTEPVSKGKSCAIL